MRDILLASVLLIYTAIEGTVDTFLIVGMLYMIHIDQIFNKYNKVVDTSRQKD